jgi:hypothetical protein
MCPILELAILLAMPNSPGEAIFGAPPYAAGQVSLVLTPHFALR